MNTPIYVLINTHSGNQDKTTLAEKISATLHATGRQVELIPLESDGDINQTCLETVLKAKEDGALVVAVGGDGTINTVAALCHTHKVVMAVIPMGTFNYFARELGMDNVDQALDAITHGTVSTVPAGFVQDNIFLNNACIGIYTYIIRNRERHKSLFGRMRIVAALSAILTMFKGLQPFTVNMTIDGKKIVRKTNLVFVGNSMVQLKNLGFEVEERTFKQKLALIILKPVTRLQTVRLLMQGMLKNLKNETRIEEFIMTHMEVNSRRNDIHAVVDGEIIKCTLPMVFRIERDALRVMTPVPQEKAA